MINLYPTPRDIEPVLSRFRDARIGVVGDFCVDAYWLLDASLQEISIETGKPVQHVLEQRYSPGGAGNVVTNLHALGIGHISVLGVIGDDMFGRELARLFQVMGVDTTGLFIQTEHWATPVYGKPVIGTTEQQRLDFGAFNHMRLETWTKLQECIQVAVNGLDFLVVNQQLPSGWCNHQRAVWIRNQLQKDWQGRHLIDTRNFVDDFAGLAMKVNQSEAASLLHVTHLEDLLLDGAANCQNSQSMTEVGEPLFITRGDQGMAMFHRSTFVDIPGVSIVGQMDPVGAGDTVTALLAACHSVGVEPAQSALLANLAASITVGKLNQTGVAQPQEILTAAGKLAYVYHPKIADELRLANYVPSTDLEILENIATFSIEMAVFDHDGTISTLRHGWEHVMEPMMIRAILGDQIRTASSELYSKVQARVRQFIEYSTGIQTISQMDSLVTMVSEFDVVPPPDRLDAWGYKEVYNQSLMTMVNERIHRLDRGELDRSDFILKGALRFLTALQSAGIKLSLFSGTDEEDAIREAGILGYGDLFEGGIHGAKPSSRADTKENIISALLDTAITEKRSPFSIDKYRLLVVGDGPVEVRLGRRYGALSLGVASLEERRWGLNETKRRRLIRAGAHMIVPDFSQWANLASYLLA